LSADEDADPLARARRIAAEMGALDKAAQMLGITIEDVGPGYATTAVTVTADMLNGVGVLHGGITFMLADMAFGVAANSHGRRCVTRSSEIEYLKPARIGDRLTAAATERRRTGRSGTYDVAITSPDGELLAEFRGRSSEFRGETW
jgi:acyl-CoA thioesterase